MQQVMAGGGGGGVSPPVPGVVHTDGGGARVMGYDVAVWNMQQGTIESILLATVHMWSGKFDKKEVVDLTVRHFVAADVFESMCVLAQSVGRPRPGGHMDTVNRSAGDLYL